MPIQIDSIGRLHARRLGRHDDGGALRGEHDRRRSNFSATRVRFFLTLLAAPAPDPNRRLPPAVKALPVALLRCLSRSRTLLLSTRRAAIDLTAVAVSAQEERLPTSVPNALNQPKIVHRPVPPPEIRPPMVTRATLNVSNASTAATEGSKGSASGPYSLVARRIVQRLAAPGQLRGYPGVLRFPRFSALVHRTKARFVIDAETGDVLDEGYIPR
jgi:hypothetical protein